MASGDGDSISFLTESSDANFLQLSNLSRSDLREPQYRPQLHFLKNRQGTAHPTWPWGPASAALCGKSIGIRDPDRIQTQDKECTTSISSSLKEGSPRLVVHVCAHPTVSEHSTCVCLLLQHSYCVTKRLWVTDRP